MFWCLLVEYPNDGRKNLRIHPPNSINPDRSHDHPSDWVITNAYWGHIDELPDPDELLGADHEAEFLPPQHKSKISPSVQGLSSGFSSLGVEEQNDLLPW